MNGVDLRAIGWVVTRDTCFEIIRSLIGVPRRMPVALLRQLAAHWAAVQASLDTDRRAARASPAAPFGAPLSARTEADLRAFLERLVAACPALYGERLMRRRLRDGALQIVVAFSLGVLLPSVIDTESAIIGDCALILLVLGGTSLVTTFQLWRMWCTIVRLGIYADAPAQSTPGGSARPTVSGPAGEPIQEAETVPPPKGGHGTRG